MIVRVALSRRIRSLGMVALAALLSGALAGCKTTGSSDSTGSISSPAAVAQRCRLAPRQRGVERIASAPIRAMPTTRSAMRRHCGRPAQRAQAAAVLETASAAQSRQRAVLGAMDALLADVGNFKQALEVLERAHFARPAGLARPVGAGRRARPDGDVTRRRSATMRVRSGSFRTSLRCSPISACLTRFPRT